MHGIDYFSYEAPAAFDALTNIIPTDEKKILHRDGQEAERNPNTKNIYLKAEFIFT